MHVQYVMHIDDIVCGKLNTRENKSTAGQVRLLQRAHHLSLCHSDIRQYLQRSEIIFPTIKIIYVHLLNQAL